MLNYLSLWHYAAHFMLKIGKEHDTKGRPIDCTIRDYCIPSDQRTSDRLIPFEMTYELRHGNQGNVLVTKARQPNNKNYNSNTVKSNNSSILITKKLLYYLMRFILL